MSPLSRRELLRGATGAAALALGGAACADEARRSGPHDDGPTPPSGRKPPNLPNLVVLFGDEWRGTDLGCAGNPDVRTPHVDRLAQEGLRFRDAFVNAPVCSPARAQMLTGLYPLSTGVVTNNMRMAPDLALLPRLLGERGYRCGYVGKWHLNGFPTSRHVPAGPQRAGFDDFWAVWGQAHDYFDSWYRRDGEERLDSPGYTGRHQTDVALEFLEAKAQGDDPFALFLSWGPPHTPHEAPAEFRGLYEPGALTFRPSVPPELEAPDRLANYYGACSALDADVGRIRAALERLGLAEDTIVVFTSDHGWQFGEHGVFGKQTPFEESIRVPMIARVPGRHVDGAVSDALFTMADFAPTVLSWMGIEVPAGMQGSDLSAAGAGPGSAYLVNVLGIGAQFDHDVFSWRGVRTATHLYAEDRGGPWLLYDLGEDPYQQHNLVLDPGRASTRDELAGELRGWYARLGEEYRTPVQHLEDLGRTDFLDEIEAMYALIPAGRRARYEEFLAAGGDWRNRRF